MAESTNRVHVSPGVYATETVDMKAATNSVGVTKLAVVGETLKGPAFQPYWISSQKEFANVFGGTSTNKFQGSNYPQYELPYIANEYLSQSNQLCVVRTLGFSGYNAGPAWVITGQKGENGTQYVIAVLRSRGTYKYRSEYAKLSDGGCSCASAYDSLTFNVGELKNVASCSAPTSYNMDAVKLDKYYDINSNGDACSSYSLGKEEIGFNASTGDMGRFTIKVIVGSSNEGDCPDTESTSASTVSIPVSLNPTDKDYIIKVLGTSNSDGTQPLFVESLYDVAWNDLVVNQGFDTISSGLTTYDVGYVADYSGIDAVNGILTMHQGELAKKDLGKRYLYSTNVTDGSPSGTTYIVIDETKGTPKEVEVAETYTFTFEDAVSGTTSVPNQAKFKITNSKYAGVYKNNNAGSGTEIKELVKCPVILNTDETISVEKISGLDLFESANCEEGYIYTVIQVLDENSKRHYVYASYSNEHVKCHEETSTLSRKGSIVYNYEDGLYYKNNGSPELLTSVTFYSNSEFSVPVAGRLYVEEANSNWKLQNTPINDDGTWTVSAGTYEFEAGPEQKNYVAKIFKEVDGKMAIKNAIIPVDCNLNDYKSAFRYSSTPWVVSNVKGDANNINVNKLFRFHTISDGANSATEVKVSIENIRPDDGTFDVVVRSYGDSDSSTSVLERFSKCTMASGKKFIGYVIGTIDGQYESKSKYITVEVSDSTAARNSVPAGFVGYSIPLYSGATISDGVKSNVSIAPIKYNTEYLTDRNKRKQYFGISDISGYDYDYFSFKGNMATLEDPSFMSHGFHLDCRVDANTYKNGTTMPTISVDGIEGYIFDGVSVNARTESITGTPIIATENDMVGSIYEDVKLRKFTMCFAGGFDGWDMYRDQRTNTDEFTYNDYKGYVNKTTGVGYGFNALNDASTYNIDGPALTSDYYSTLAGVSLLKNPEEVDINLLATPGIDTVNNTKLVNEVFDILDDRADTFYIVTTPDKESGSGDYADEIPEVDDMVQTFLDKEIHSDYAATYYPWVKIEDNGEYIYLPATRDVVRNMAQSDNGNTTQNLAPAGLTRGRVDAIRARKNLKLAESDALYEENINPVRTYAQEGVVVMGQKTLRESDDLLNRIDVRRCVLRMRKLIAIGTLGLIFDPNDSNTVKSFKSIVSGIMEGFITNRAISNWKMDVDESDEAKDRLEIPATIYIKPIRALEYISINFVVTNDGTYFED